MPRCTKICSAAMAVLFAAASAIHSQTAFPAFQPLEPIAFDLSGPVLRAHTEALKPFTVAGEHGVLVGQQDGSFEAWVLPVKVLSHLSIEADVEGYTVPIDVNQQSAEIEVRPDRTIITYSHIAFTVRQIMFSPAAALPGSGPVVLYQFDCVKPTDFVFRFTPNLESMWPERNEGHPNPEWVAPGPDAYARAGGYYVLHSDYPDLAAAVTIPGARPGILAPYQERPQIHPVELKLHIDPARDQGKLFPLLMAVGRDAASANTAALGTALANLNTKLAASYADHHEHYRDFTTHSTSIVTPDARLNEAFKWAEISIEQLKTHVPQASTSPAASKDESALVAGYYASGDSARPGFGWFFGRDALYTLYAVNGFGDFALTRAELEFLIRRQREDGKIMHEYSQTAAFIDWRAFPYMYAAADATPLFLLAMNDYVRASGDVAFLAAHREAVEKAWTFETTHAPGPDQGGNGIYTNAQGTGWVESWPGGMPQQEIYLALLDQQASAAMAQLASLWHDEAASKAAQSRANTIAATINKQFYSPGKGCYAFSRNVKDGAASLDATTTVYPALAWWSGASLLEHSGECLSQFAEASLDTDWGLRDVANTEKVYDGMSYHQGSVWPLFTGWAALAEFRGNQPLAGYKMLKENAELTWAQDVGAVTELLSGDFFVPFGRSTSHQLWSSAMVITPTLRGLFGIDIDAVARTITVNPHLPASWHSAAVMDLPIGAGHTSLRFEKRGGILEVTMNPGSEEGWTLRSTLEGASYGSISSQTSKSAHTAVKGLRIPLPPLEVDNIDPGSDLAESVRTALPDHLPAPGARTSEFRVIHSETKPNQLSLTIEGRAGSDGVLRLIRNEHLLPKVKTQSEGSAEEASISFRACDANPDACSWLPLLFHFPAGEGWKTVTLTLSW